MAAYRCGYAPWGEQRRAGRKVAQRPLESDDDHLDIDE